MSKVPLHALIWSSDQRRYELYIQGRLEQRLCTADDVAWLTWLGGVTSFAFHGSAGSLNVYQEARSRGGRYWYAYHTINGHTHKRYLGQTTAVSLARLEETAQFLSHGHDDAHSLVSERLVLDGDALLLLARTVPPRLPRILVARERLLATLNESLSAPFTLLSAAAGWGKTTLLSAWAHHHQEQVAWLSLDEWDNTPNRFWSVLIAALRRRVPHLGETTLALLQSSHPPPLSACLSALLVELESWAELSAPLVLMVDDYQVIGKPAIHESLTYWVEHLPTCLHLVLSSRVNPALPLSRWRAQGRMAEIRMDDLRFAPQEAGSYLDQMLSPSLSADEVRQLAQRTEGWIAGLQLAALALQKRTDRAKFLQTFTGSQRDLLDYVQEEILNVLPPPVRDFLLHVAILARLDASVCQAVTASPDKAASQQMLASLERANLFMIPLDEQRHTYRLHDLFRETLLTALRNASPELLPVLHGRAARYYEARGMWSKAIVHALEAADYCMVAHLMEQTVEQFWLRGEAATMANWALALPQQVVREHARLLLTIALYLLATVAQTTEAQRARTHTQVRQLLTQVEITLQRPADEARSSGTALRVNSGASGNQDTHAAEDALLHRRLRLLRAWMTWFETLATPEYSRLHALYHEIQDLDRDDEMNWHLIPLFTRFILHYTLRQEGAMLVPQLMEAKQQGIQSGSQFATLRVMQWLAMAAIEAGRLHLAYDESRAALDVIAQTVGYVLLKGYFAITQALALYQWNRLDQARRLLQTAVHDAARWEHLDILGLGCVVLLQVELADGAMSSAKQTLQTLEHVAQHERYGFYPGFLPVLRAQVWLAQGHLQDASDWATSVFFPEATWESRLYAAFPVVIQVYFAQRRWVQALELLERWRGHMDRPENVAFTIRFLAQYLVALHHTGKYEQSREILVRLLTLTEPEGCRRVFLDEGEPMRHAIQAWLAAQTDVVPSTMAFVTTILTAFAEERRTGQALETVSPHPVALSLASPPCAGAMVSAVALTRRERDVLGLLVAGASNQDIARTLVISLTTAKKHVSNILGKLGASSRTQAIARARTCSLL